MNDGRHVTEIDFVCPFCGRRVDVGHGPSGNGQILHEMPMCANFEQLEPADYLEFVRREFAARGPS